MFRPVLSWDFVCSVYQFSMGRLVIVFCTFVFLLFLKIVNDSLGSFPCFQPKITKSLLYKKKMFV